MLPPRKAKKTALKKICLRRVEIASKPASSRRKAIRRHQSNKKINLPNVNEPKLIDENDNAPKSQEENKHIFPDDVWEFLREDFSKPELDQHDPLAFLTNNNDENQFPSQCSLQPIT